MQIGPNPSLHLTYCSNLFPANGWPEVFSNLQRYAPALKARLSPHAPFGLGLRLSSRESEALLSGQEMDRFKAFLDENGLYLFTLNGFPFGAFHRQRIKAGVFAPDWRTDMRVHYTLRLIEILRRLLPEGIDGGISTSPLTYKRWMIANDPSTWESIVQNLARIASALVSVRRETGKRIHLDLEPEPDGLLENSGDILDFYQRYLLPIGAPLLARQTWTSVQQAERNLLKHIRICYDASHMAVAYEEPAAAVDRLSRAEIRIGKVQISAAMEVAVPPDRDRLIEIGRQLDPFRESIYLHQVVERESNGTLRRYADLSDLYPIPWSREQRTWRIHFHLPLFVSEFGYCRSTREETEVLLRRVREKGLTQHLEIETYGWEFLPPELRRDRLDAMTEEYRWVLGRLKMIGKENRSDRTPDAA
ncbi:MAG: metabolite traffic protein EboE [Nitrospirae bacterium]|nr:metabolite traffic protein EboE [Candidatus Manganitrophaceae bacterium]